MWLGTMSGGIASWLSVISKALHIVFGFWVIDENRSSVWLCDTYSFIVWL